MLKYFSSCLGDSTAVLLVDFISGMDTTMIHLKSQRADLNLSPHFSNTAHDQVSWVQAGNLFIHKAALEAFRCLKPACFKYKYKGVRMCQGAESPHQDFLTLVSLGFPDSPALLCLHAHCRN